MFPMGKVSPVCLVMDSDPILTSHWEIRAL